MCLLVRLSQRVLWALQLIGHLTRFTAISLFTIRLKPTHTFFMPLHVYCRDVNKSCEGWRGKDLLNVKLLPSYNQKVGVP